MQITFDDIVSDVERWLSVGKSDKPYRDALKLYEGAEMQLTGYRSYRGLGEIGI